LKLFFTRLDSRAQKYLKFNKHLYTQSFAWQNLFHNYLQLMRLKINLEDGKMYAKMKVQSITVAYVFSLLYNDFQHQYVVHFQTHTHSHNIFREGLKFLFFSFSCYFFKHSTKHTINCFKQNGTVCVCWKTFERKKKYFEYVILPESD
jgi:hypothetical protein